MKQAEALCSARPFLIKLIDERLIKKTPTTVPGHCLIGPLEVLGLPVFTNLKLSACHWLPDGLLCYVTDVRKTPKPPFSEGWVGGGGDEEEGGGRCILESGITVCDWRSWFIIRAVWIYTVEHTCSMTTTSDLLTTDLSPLPKFRVRSCCLWVYITLFFKYCYFIFIYCIYFLFQIHSFKCSRLRMC